MCSREKSEANGYHRDHLGSGEPLETRIATASWMSSPDDKRALLGIMMEMVWLLHELDEITIPWEALPHTGPMAALDDLKWHVANYICGEGDWRPVVGPVLGEWLGEGEES